MEVQLMELRSAMGRIQSYLATKLGYTPQMGEIFSAVSYASQIGNVRESFLLAVLQIESKFGFKADSFEKKWGGRTFEKIKEKCGLNQYETLLEIVKYLPGRNLLDKNSTPMSYVCAMGPAQALPTTWQGYVRKYKKYFGKDHPDPWNLKDSLTFMALYLRNWGADKKNYYYEWTAAQGYLTGQSWTPDYCNWNPNPGEKLANWDSWYDTYCPAYPICTGINNYCRYGADVNYTTYKWQETIEICGGLNLTCPHMEERIKKLLKK